MTPRDFDAEAAQTTTGEPSGTFVLGGRQWRVRNKDDLSLGFFNLFNKDGKVTVGPFFAATIYPDDLAEFMAMIEAPDGPLTKGNLSAVIDHVTELVTDRPTKPERSSGDGSSRTVRKSTRGSSSRATPQRRSA